LEERFGELLLEQVEWVSLGGAFIFTGRRVIRLNAFCARLKQFAGALRRGQVLLEQGEAAINHEYFAGSIGSRYLYNGSNWQVVDSFDSSAQCLICLILSPSQRRWSPARRHEYMVCGKSCLAGDIFGEFNFNKR